MSSDVSLTTEWPYYDDSYSENVLIVSSPPMPMGTSESSLTPTTSKSPHRSGESLIPISNSLLPTPPVLVDYSSSPSAFSVNPSSPSVAPRLLGDPVLGASSPVGLEWPPMVDVDEVDLPTSDPPTTEPKLIIHPINVKSRVETQVIMRLSLYPIPDGVTKLHLPSHAISKPKLLTKPPPSSSPDMYELDTILVCTTAMQAPDKMQEALTHAATTTARDRELARMEPPEGTEERETMSGWDVNICSRCIERERKRLNRRRNKRSEEEEDWLLDEHMRIIVFNTREIQEWGEPRSDPDPVTPKTGPEPELPAGTKQVMLPVRIACYCRHHHEKIGFRVIFTLKDHQGRLVTQALSDSIMITDDHKKEPASPARRPSSEGGPGTRIFAAFSVDGQLPGPKPSSNSQPTSSQSGTPFPGATQTMSPLAASMHFPYADMAPVRQSHSISDLQSLRNNYVSASPFTPFATGLMQRHSQSSSASGTPRALSPTAHFSGPATKRRKAGSSGRVPESLAMTRLDTATAQTSSSVATPPGSARGAGGSSTSSLNDTLFPSNEQAFDPFSIAFRPHHFSSTVPATPSGSGPGLFSPGGYGPSSSTDDFGAHQAFYSAPTSAHHSRAGSPTGIPRTKPSLVSRHGSGGGVTADDFFDLTPSSSTWPNPPSINQLIPSQGPKKGGIDISVVGSGFYQGLEVMIGEKQAATTRFWNENLLVCSLPPADQAGPVFIRFKHDIQPQLMPAPPQQETSVTMTRSPFQFRYLDDDEDRMLRLALTMIGHSITGKVEDAVDVARRIVNEKSIARQAGTGASSADESMMMTTTDIYNGDGAMVE
ncbi:MAG: hypothetical protein M1816_001284 [Peltula sp. TS41687]|nr:MAG: hypothetical protein M1816_001284 [Peltula sp. TS41687]